MVVVVIEDATGAVAVAVAVVSAAAVATTRTRIGECRGGGLGCRANFG